MTLAERLKEIRREHNFTQLDLAEVLGIDRTAYTYYEMGKTQPSAAKLWKLARIYNVTVGYLMGVEENRPELIRQKVSDSLSAEVDPIAMLQKDERKILMWYRLLSPEQKRETEKELQRRIQE